MYQKLRLLYKSFIHESFEWNWYYCTLPASLMKPLKDKSEELCHLLQEAYSHPIQHSAANLDTYPHVKWVFFTNVFQLIF